MEEKKRINLNDHYVLSDFESEDLHERKIVSPVDKFNESMIRNLQTMIDKADQLKFSEAFNYYKNIEKLLKKNEKMFQKMNLSYFKKIAQFMENLQKINYNDVISRPKSDKKKFQRFKTKILTSYLKKENVMMFKQVHDYAKSNDIWEQSEDNMVTSEETEEKDPEFWSEIDVQKWLNEKGFNDPDYNVIKSVTGSTLVALKNSQKEISEYLQDEDKQLIFMRSLKELFEDINLTLNESDFVFSSEEKKILQVWDFCGTDFIMRAQTWLARYHPELYLRGGQHGHLLQVPPVQHGQHHGQQVPHHGQQVPHHGHQQQYVILQRSSNQGLMNQSNQGLMVNHGNNVLGGSDVQHLNVLGQSNNVLGRSHNVLGRSNNVLGRSNVSVLGQSNVSVLNGNGATKKAGSKLKRVVRFLRPDGQTTYDARYGDDVDLLNDANFLNERSRGVEHNDIDDNDSVETIIIDNTHDNIDDINVNGIISDNGVISDRGSNLLVNNRGIFSH